MTTIHGSTTPVTNNVQPRLYNLEKKDKGIQTLSFVNDKGRAEKGAINLTVQGNIQPKQTKKGSEPIIKTDALGAVEKAVTGFLGLIDPEHQEYHEFTSINPKHPQLSTDVMASSARKDDKHSGTAIQLQYHPTGKTKAEDITHTTNKFCVDRGQGSVCLQRDQAGSKDHTPKNSKPTWVFTYDGKIQGKTLKSYKDILGDKQAVKSLKTLVDGSGYTYKEILGSFRDPSTKGLVDPE